MLLEETETFTTGNSVQVTELNPSTIKNIVQRIGGGITAETVAERLGMRALGLQGVITKLFLCFENFAYEVAWVDEMGSRNGTMGVVFSGEFKRIPDLLVHS